MKLILLILLISGCANASTPQPTPSATIGPIPSPSPMPASVTLELMWNLNPDPQVTEYRVYMSTTKGGEYVGNAPTLSATVPACQVMSPVNSCMITIPTYTVEYFVATSINAAVTPPLESPPSNEIGYEYPQSLASPIPGMRVIRVNYARAPDECIFCEE